MESVPDQGMAKFIFSAVCERGVRTAVVLVALLALSTVLAAPYTGQGGLDPLGCAFGSSFSLLPSLLFFCSGSSGPGWCLVTVATIYPSLSVKCHVMIKHRQPGWGEGGQEGKKD